MNEQNKSLPSSSEVKSRASWIAFSILIQAIIIMALSGQTGWKAIFELRYLAAFAFGIAAGISMARSTKGWGS